MLIQNSRAGSLLVDAGLLYGSTIKGYFYIFFLLFFHFFNTTASSFFFLLSGYKTLIRWSLHWFQSEFVKSCGASINLKCMLPYEDLDVFISIKIRCGSEKSDGRVWKNLNPEVQNDFSSRYVVVSVHFPAFSVFLYVFLFHIVWFSCWCSGWFCSKIDDVLLVNYWCYVHELMMFTVAVDYSTI